MNASWTAVEDAQPNNSLFGSLAALELDPDMAPLMESIRMGGAAVAMQLYQDKELMQKLSRKMFGSKLGPERAPAVDHASAGQLDAVGLGIALSKMDSEKVRLAAVQAINDMSFSVTLSDPDFPDCVLIGCSAGFEALTLQ